ncbi:transposase [Streptomyces umbrinus]|uniref:transposase n=1 Tax=Streptomyces umbrinus TaxID=67370 RepID=UPI003C303E97
MAGGDASSAPPSLHDGPLSRLPATTLGRGRAQCQESSPGDPGQGIPRPLPAREDGRRTPATRAALDQPRERPPSPREAARWITTHPDRRSLHVSHRLHRLLEHCPDLKRTHDLVRRLAGMLDNRDASSLPSWLDELSHSGLAPLAGIAGALREDQHAVAQGIATTYNSGVNEGRITDVKLQKRLMAGRGTERRPA